ncbi:MAG: Aminodeoxyfutalosine synthase [Elusimicrobia bacterium]|nr:Aminodeoxyfutalosine synthase [Elusimicrobiota bacterium]
MQIKDPNIVPLWRKIQNGERLSFEDGRSLFASSDLHGVGTMANWVKEQKTGQVATFVMNRQINPTNICVLSCHFCDYASKENWPNAYRMSTDEILSKLNNDLHEVHIVSGLYRGWTFDEYLDVIRVVRKNFPAIQVKAYTAVEIDFFARRENKSIKEILQIMKDEGVVCIPGGGAEVFSERVRKALYPFKIGAPKWLEVHRTAHQLGLRSNSTLLYGHMETIDERLQHMLKLRELQDETGGFLSFIPLAYQPGTTQVVKRQTSVVDDLKMIAVARLMLDNFDHIKAYWVTMGEDTASIALNFGADDIDGTIGEEKIMHAAKASSPLRMARERLVNLIRESHRIPVERDCLYHEVRRFELHREPVGALV